MVYKFTCYDKNTFFLSADSKAQLYRRVREQYGVLEDDITILEEYKETDNFGVELVKKHSIKTDSTLYDKATEMLNNSKRRPEPAKTEYIKKYKFKSSAITSADDIVPLIKKFKKVKIYWEPTKKRGVHSYYAVYK